MDQERYKQLKQRASQVLSKLNHLTGDGAYIHDRNAHRENIANRLKRLAEKGEYVYRGKYITSYCTLDGLEGLLDKVEAWIRGKR